MYLEKYVPTVSDRFQVKVHSTFPLLKKGGLFKEVKNSPHISMSRKTQKDKFSGD